MTSLESVSPPSPICHSKASYDVRASIGDMSLHSLTPTTLTKPQQKRLQEMIRGSMSIRNGKDLNLSKINHDANSDLWVDGMTDDGGSFFTAKGTIKSLKPKLNHNGIEENEEVDEEVLVLVHQPGKSTISKKGHHEQEWTYGETPMPSRVLYLFHPPKPAATGFTASNLNVNAWSWIESARESLERAFWGILMPSVSGVVGVTEKVGNGFVNMINILPSPATLSLEGSVAWQTSSSIQHPTDPKPEISNHKSTYSFSASASLRKEFQQKQKSLYDQETLYTLRLPQCQQDGNELDIGPTAKPLHIRKRAGLPWKDEHKLDDGRHELGWGQNAPPYNMGIGLGMGMRV
ncbi:uncharacterized protein L201_007943 [Kwoniella dendrophila CBS 6074]|uniref:Uncharacterized protein n=1 Tax=Kwoniella dendrophila CBS 6074 TaxID=1295534 RepID=A0AAX4K754_9TREE